MTSLKLSEIHRALESALKDLSRRIDPDSLDPSVDLYWRIPDDALFDVYHEPTEMEIGSLQDDARNICRINDGELATAADMQAICAWLTWLSIEALKD